jgi:hypothetical protein
VLLLLLQVTPTYTLEFARALATLFLVRVLSLVLLSAPALVCALLLQFFFILAAVLTLSSLLLADEATIEDFGASWSL